mmetsp:Transcript_26855/g.40443  ORF Transcript_26855/g.40443 Transcript_26855/m.40443 type:complete len:99 (+) Transcript_26855:111-407(+)
MVLALTKSPANHSRTRFLNALKHNDSTMLTQEYDSKNDGMAKLEAERAKRSAWDERKLATEDEKFAKKHLASQFGKEPLIPFHLVQWDPMHGSHCSCC